MLYNYKSFIIKLKFGVVNMFSVKSSHFSAQIISRTALVITMTIVLNQIRFFKMPQGGDVGFGTMIPLILLACCYGGHITLLAGFICGIIGLMMDPYFYHPVQVLFDYPFPYMAMAVVSIFKKRIILGTIVLIHEFGHFIFSKLFGVYVYEYSIGMGKKIFSFKPKNSETEYCIRLFPIGGFVRLVGEEGEDGDTEVPQDRKLYKKGFWQRFLIFCMGPGFNMLLAIVSLFIMCLLCA